MLNKILTILLLAGTLAAAKECPQTNIYTELVQAEGLEAGVNFYALPTWITTPGPVPLIWTEPADVIYLEEKGQYVADTGTILDPVGSWRGAPEYFCMGLRVEGGTPPYSYTVINAPPGLTVNEGGNYGGVRMATGWYTNIIFCATDAAKTTVCLKPRQQQLCDFGTHRCSGFGN